MKFPPMSINWQLLYLLAMAVLTFVVGILGVATLVVIIVKVFLWL